MLTNAINTYKEFLDALEDGEKSVTVTAEFYAWLAENLRETQTISSKSSSMEVYGAKVYKEGRK